MLYTNFCSLGILQRQRREPERKRVMILDLHIHTSWHSADSNLSPIDLIREAKHLGLDGVVVTEHDRGWDRFRARDLAAEHNFLFLRGMEVSTDLGHILVCGLEEYVSGIQRAERWASAAPGSRSDGGAKAGERRLQAGVRQVMPLEYLRVCSRATWLA